MDTAIVEWSLEIRASGHPSVLRYELAEGANVHLKREQKPPRSGMPPPVLARIHLRFSRRVRNLFVRGRGSGERGKAEEDIHPPEAGDN